MPPFYVYHPVVFYTVVMCVALVLCPVAHYLNNRKGWLLPCMILGIFVPCVTALVMLFQNEILVADFWRRLFLFQIDLLYLLFILLVTPVAVYVATWVSLYFGFGKEQFQVTHQMSVMKGWAVVGVVIPLVVAPLIEELGWRGYGVDSLRAYMNLFNTSLLFGILWGAWHLPAFFVEGYYQNQLWKLGRVYVINFFVSCVVLSFLMNWVYYKTDRSIPALVLFHGIANFSLMVLRTEPFTKCIVTVVVAFVAMILLVCDRHFFF